MTTPEEDPTAAIVRQAEERNRARLEAVRPLARVLTQINELKAHLDELETSYGRFYADAERAGWSPEELSSLGAEAPTKRPRGRPAKRGKGPRKTSATKSRDLGATPAEAVTSTGLATVPQQQEGTTESEPVS